MALDRDFLETTVEPQADDSTDVRWALETAVAMWIRGSRDQTLKWLHTAMQTATHEGRHDRAYSLGRVLSELEQRPLPPRRSHRPPGVAPSPVSTTELIAEGTRPLEPARTRPSKSMMKTSPYKLAPDEVTSHFMPDSALLEACQASEPELKPEREAADSITDVPTPEVLKVPKERPRPPTVMSDGLDATLVNVRPVQPPPSRDPVERTVVMSDEELMAPSISPTSARSHGPPTTVGSPQATLEPMRAVRVAITSGQGRELVLRLLGPGEPAPEGTQEALLVPVER